MTLQDVPFVQMEPFDLVALQQEDLVLDSEPGNPFRFGHNIDVDLNMQNSGTLEIIKDSKLWRLGISSPGAKTINLTFDQYNLPEGATLHVYTPDRQHIIGAFTHLNNQADGQFATTLVRGDAVILEYFEPHDADFPGEINLTTVTHGYRGVNDYALQGFGDAGACNLNVACDASEGWEDQVRGVVMLVSGSNGFCSGSLINNTANDGTPYVLSANHCYRNPGTVVFWFNWQSETCANPTSSPPHDALSGATQIARHSATDFWLMQLNQTPPDEYNVFYSGWNRTLDSSISGYIFGIHHPRADIKKFSYLFDGVTTSSYLGATGSGNTHWRVGTWADGTTTEPGSSGSPLYDGEGRIIGQLHGGYAACGNTLEDWYGNLGMSWEGGGSPATRLKDWLDPGDTGAWAIDGYDPQVGQHDVDAQLSAIIEPSGNMLLGEPLTPTVRIRNGGIEDLTSATVSYTINENWSQSIEWTGLLETAQSEIIEFDTITLPAGHYEFTATISAPGDENPDNDSRSRSFRVVDCSSPFTLPFEEDFNESASKPDCWEIADHIGNGQVWLFGRNGSMNGTTGNYAFLNSDAYGSGNSQNSDLITPPLNLTYFADINISFTHYFRQFSGSSATFSYSVDNGETWVQAGQWTTTTPNPTTFSLDVPEAEGKSQVRFKWNYTGTWGWYWSFDDLVVSGTFLGGPPAQVQMFHNSADPILSSADVYVDGLRYISNAGFAHNSGYREFPSGDEVTVEVRASGSSETLYLAEHSFSPEEYYTLVLNGVSDHGSFTPNPDGHPISLDLNVLTGKMERGAYMMEVYFHNGVTDSPALDFRLLDGTMLAEQVGYGEITTEAVKMFAYKYFMEVVDSATGERLYVFEFDISQYLGRSILIFTNGFISPENNQNGHPFNIVAMLDDGELIDLRNATSSGGDDHTLPTAYLLDQNYPNPFNPTTSIRYALPEASHVRLDVYNINGQRVATLVNGTMGAGYHTAIFEAGNLSSGIYIYRLQAGDFTDTRKMMLLK